MKGKIFNAQEVQAMLNGSKVQFREVIKHKDSSREICPYQVGQKIFVKEVFSHSNQRWSDKTMFYKASHGNRIQNTFSVANREDKWRSPTTMHEEDSRLTLLIKEIKVERLGDISADDCWKEGISYSPECCQNYIAVADCNGNPTPICCNNPNVVHPQPQFEQIWNATHKKPEEKFEANPWIWKVQFEIINN